MSRERPLHEGILQRVRDTLLGFVRRAQLKVGALFGLRAHTLVLQPRGKAALLQSRRRRDQHDDDGGAEHQQHDAIDGRLRVDVDRQLAVAQQVVEQRHVDPEMVDECLSSPFGSIGVANARVQERARDRAHPFGVGGGRVRDERVAAGVQLRHLGRRLLERRTHRRHGFAVRLQEKGIVRGGVPANPGLFVQLIAQRRKRRRARIAQFFRRRKCARDVAPFQQAAGDDGRDDQHQNNHGQRERAHGLAVHCG